MRRRHRLDARGPGLELALGARVGGVAADLHVVHARHELVLGEQQGVGGRERGQQLALGQVAGGAEDHHRAGLRQLGLAPRRALNELGGVGHLGRGYFEDGYYSAASCAVGEFCAPLGFGLG